MVLQKYRVSESWRPEESKVAPSVGRCKSHPCPEQKKGTSFLIDFLHLKQGPASSEVL